ncbi:MAG: Fic family protein [Clostridia bacterium]|nr:Fic family protein [Clostridia bacterium]MDD4048478.1 Fic family protein [Clostridia bacterium]
MSVALLSLDKFTQMISDKSVFDLEKMLYKYGKEELIGFIETLQKSFYMLLPLKDFDGNNITLLSCKINLTSQLKKILLKAYDGQKYGFQAMESEIISTLAIERIESTRDSVRKLLLGGAPTDENNKKAYGIKKGLDFISDTSNEISEENLHMLYMLSVGDYLSRDDALPKKSLYRDDVVYVVGDNITHEGLSWKKIPKYMDDLINYINTNDDLDQVVKSIVIHYYFVYLHPYFDGNGRMARLLQLWYLVQMGYSQALFIPFSAFINESKGKYYKAFTKISGNRKVSGVLDITPFVLYFTEHVFAKLGKKTIAIKVLSDIETLLSNGFVTVKEKELINYVLSTYGYNEFSTKQLEKDFGNAAYATIRGFVIKFEEHGILAKVKYGQRVKYRIV